MKWVKDMNLKREREGDTVNVSEDGVFASDPKRQKLISQSSPSSSSPPPAPENSLLPGFNYGEEDEEEENLRRPPFNGRTGKNGIQEEEDEDDDDYPLDQGVGQVKRSRDIEIRRDCPYLDTVNRQVY